MTGPATAQATTPRRTLIVTADDFGLSLEVNEAVEEAHRTGILTCASLMIGGPASADAIARARRLPRLGVGLHLTLTAGQALLDHASLPRLTDRAGRFRGSMPTVSFRLVIDRALRRELRHEIHAQFEAFRASGLSLDHVDTHKHFHTHPFVFEDLVGIGRSYGLRSLRIPSEPHRPGRAIAGGSAPRISVSTLAMALPLRRMRRRCRELGLTSNDCVLGLRASGAMDKAHVLRALRAPLTGVVELYLHPAMISGADVDPQAATARHAEEYQALIDPEVKRAAHDLGWRLSTYGELASGTEDRPPSPGIRPPDALE